MTIPKSTRILLVLLASTMGLAQSSPTNSPLMGDIRPISFRPDVGETNVVFTRLAASAAADDNLNNSNSHPIGGAQYSLAPGVSIQETHPHLVWGLSYRPTLRFFVPQVARPDMFGQAFDGNLQYNFTKHLTLDLRQHYLHTTDPFEQLGEGGSGLLTHPGTVALGNIRRTQLLSQIELDYRVSKHTTLGVDGTFMKNDYHRPFGRVTSFLGSRDKLGSAFLSHQFTPRQSFGVQYQFADILFPGQDSHTTTHGVLFFDQVAISPHTSLLIFGGPEYSMIHNNVLVNFLGIVVRIPESSVLWSPGVGAMLERRGQRLAFRGSYVERVSDGGGLMGAVHLKNGGIRITGKLARRWEAYTSSEVTNRSLLNVSRVDKLEVLDLGAGIGHELSRGCWIRAMYQRRHNIGGDSTLQFGNHNRITLTIEREFIMPIGR